MTMNEQPKRSSQFGESLGRKWRYLAQIEKRLADWLSARGVNPALITTLKWLVRLGIAIPLLYLSLWVAAIFVLVILAVRSVANANTSPEEWVIDDHGKHRKSGFYDPINYSDTDDPRF